ncbi:MAG: transposase [Bacteroidetes bacterium GWA2_31_9b]|nr:MAG: transposase [Bacteroidetes bacterium GWA2_31_9b]
MSTYTQILYQLVFSTYKRERTLTKENRNELFQYVNGILKNKKCHLYWLNEVEDHIHIVTHIHTTIAPANLVKDIKLATSSFIADNKLFANFNGWQNGYGAFTYSINEKERLIEYVKNQEEHHKIKTFKDEYIQLLKENGVEFDEKYFL